MSPSFTHLKALRAKINSKIGKVKSSMHKNKAAVDETELNAQPKCVEGKVQDSTNSDSEPNGEELQEIIAAPKPNNNGKETVVASEPKINGEEITASSKPITNGEVSAQQVMVAPKPIINGEVTMITSKPTISGEEGAQETVTAPKPITNSRAITVTSEPIINSEEEDTQPTIVIPKPTINNEETMVASQPNISGEEGHELGELNRDANNKQEKAAKRQAKREARKERRQARKAKWAARGATFKEKSKKVGEAVFWPTLGVILCPVMLALDACLCIYKGVVWVVVKIVDTLCCGPVLVGLVCCACKK